MKRGIGCLFIFCYVCLMNLGLMKVDASAPDTVVSVSLQDHYIASFRQSFGFLDSKESDSLVLLGDSLVAALEAEHEVPKAFELRRIVIRAHILRGENRMAIAKSDLLYSKAQASESTFGMVMALNAMGEVYAQTNRMKDAINSQQKALIRFEDPSEDQILTKILLLEQADYALHLGRYDISKTCLDHLNRYSQKNASATERGLVCNYNAYYAWQTGAWDEARAFLKEGEELIPRLPVGIVQHLYVTKAFYHWKIKEYEEAMKAFACFFNTDNPERNQNLYIEVMRGKADMLIEMGKKEEAYDLYSKVYSYVNFSFKTNYPKEMDLLSARFQADQLKSQNEHARMASSRFYAVGLVICALVLLIFIFLGWKRIFRLKESKKRQEEMKRKAENAIRKKNQFLSNMSHEVRTPLNAIVGFSTLLSSEEDTGMDADMRKEACEIIRVNSQQLLNLINDILDLSDFEEDNIHFTIKEHDAVKVCTEVIETIRASYKLEVDLRFETKLPRLIMDTDDSRLRQVMINLLGNAAKFTKQGSITLALEMADEDTALFSVTDTGCGISPDKQKLVFERFEKLNEHVQGTGLGLSICQLIVTFVKGKIWIDEKYTDGARFCFTHPLKYK